ncbi:MAG: phosphate ABC transporter substrate-binding protein [Bacillota bacterium]|nr:phosphate ABC transporter substrate-binding protein [Bacillota bacterium]
MTNKFFQIISIVLLMAFIAGCGGQAAIKKSNQTDPGNTKKTITIAGSTSLLPISESLAEAYRRKNPGIAIYIQGGGSAQGIKGASEGICDIGTISRSLHASEEKLGLKATTIALDGLAVILHPDNPIKNLTHQQVKKIFTGEIKNWKEINGADMPINVVNREEGSGTRDAFEQVFLGDEFRITENAVIQSSNGAVRKTVATDKYSIAYLSLGYVNEEVKSIAIDQVAPTIENVKTGTYRFARPLIFLTPGEPAGTTKDFIEFVLGPEGQHIVEQHYVRVN